MRQARNTHDRGKRSRGCPVEWQGNLDASYIIPISGRPHYSVLFFEVLSLERARPRRTQRNKERPMIRGHTTNPKIIASRLRRLKSAMLVTYRDLAETRLPLA